MNDFLPSVTYENLEVILDELVDSLGNEFKKILVITPDATRTCPLPCIIPGLQKRFNRKNLHVDYLIALGTHRYLTEKDIIKLYGITEKEDFSNSRIENHEWKSSQIFTSLGSISFKEKNYSDEVEILLNRKILDYDVILPISPVFPHEIAGFSGGPKYFFPGISGGEFLQTLHWQAVVTGRWNIMGIKDTSTRRIINKAAALIPTPVVYLTMAVDMTNNIKQISWGSYPETWDKTVEISKKIHIRHTGRQYKKVIAIAPPMYQELWTAAKAMYKLDQIVEPGGQLILYGPHITTVSFMWDQYIDKMGFHTLDYLLENFKDFEMIPRGVLSFSTNVRGPGKINGDLDEPRISLVLATNISMERCLKTNLKYLSYDSLNINERRNESDTLIVDHAGEILYLV